MSNVPEEASQLRGADVSRTPSSSHSVREQVSFSGTGREYFGIWIVNILLTIVTLGIYSAWAKVRSTRYFYDNTSVAGASFDYHGNPKAILKGRAIALVMVLAYHFAFRFSVQLGAVTVLILAMVAPWLIWKSLQFKLYNTSYRGIRFGFGGSLGGAYYTYLLMPFIAAITFGIGLPLMLQRIKRFQHQEARYGTTSFSFTATVMQFYKVYGWITLIAISGFFCLMLFTFFLVLVAGVWLKSHGGPSTHLRYLGPFLAYPPVVVLMAIFRSMLQNLVWNHTQLAPHRFDYHLRWRGLVWIYLTNFFGVILTLGLFTPFAMVRLRKYQLEAMTLALAGGGVDGFVAQARSPTTAIGEGAMDLTAFDISL